MNVRHYTRPSTWLAVPALFGALVPDVEAATLTGFNSSVWPRSDASMGIAGYVIEDFEDTALAPGLRVTVTSPSKGSYGPVSTLPFTFSAAQDPGTAFNQSLMWDGTHGLVNRPSMPLTTYGNDGGWSDVYFLFNGGVSSLGFSYGQAEGNILISLDFGSGYTTVFNSTSYLPASGGRNGYLRIDAAPGETIYGIKLDNQIGNHDGILYDHLAFQPVAASVPDGGSTLTLMLMVVGLAATGGFLRRKSTRDAVGSAAT